VFGQYRVPLRWLVLYARFIRVVYLYLEYATVITCRIVMFPSEIVAPERNCRGQVILALVFTCLRVIIAHLLYLSFMQAVEDSCGQDALIWDINQRSRAFLIN
jgi:hypothetical protein